MGRCSAESSFWQNRINDRRWFSYKSSYNRESSGRSFNHNTIENIGGADRDRTDDLLNAIQALSQLSYGPTREKLKAKG